MATWKVSDEIDARLRARLGGDGDFAAAFVEHLVLDHLDLQESPAFEARATERIKRGMRSFDQNGGLDAKQVIRGIADRLNLDPPR